MPFVVVQARDAIVTVSKNFDSLTTVFLQKRESQFDQYVINPLIPKIKMQILLSCPHTFHIEVVGRIERVNISREFILSDYIRNSHDLSDRLSIDITRRNLMLITIRP